MPPGCDSGSRIPSLHQLAGRRGPAEFGAAKRSAESGVSEHEQPGMDPLLIRPVLFPRHVRTQKVELRYAALQAAADDFVHQEVPRPEFLKFLVIGGLEEKVPIPQLEGVMEGDRPAVEPQEITGQLAALGGHLRQLRIEYSPAFPLGNGGTSPPSTTLAPVPQHH